MNSETSSSHACLDRVTEIISKEVKDEKENIQQTVLTVLSAYSENPQNTRVLAPSGEGKTYLVNNVSNFFLQDNITKLSNATPQSFKYSSTKKVIETESGNFQDYGVVVDTLKQNLKIQKDPIEKRKIQQEIKELESKAYDLVDLNHKCLIFLDSQSMQLWNSLKTNLSHDDKYIKSLTANKTKNGSIKGQRIVFAGYPAVIYCSARDEVSLDKTDEINTRFNTISLKGNPEKYRKMLQLQSLKASLPGPLYEMEVMSQTEIEECKALVLQMIENVKKYGNEKHPILNLFGDKIAKQFKNDGGYRTRQLGILNSMITMLVLSHADQRPLVVIDDVEYPIALKKDIFKANELTKEPISIAVSKIQFLNEKIKPAILNVGKDRNTVIGTVKVASAREIAEEIQSKNPETSIDRQRLLETYLQPLVARGYIEEMEDPDSKRQHIFSLSEKYLREDAKLESTFIDISTLDESCVNAFKEKHLNHRLKEGRIKFFDKSGREITSDELIKIVNQIDDQTLDTKPKNKIVESSTDVDFQKLMELFSVSRPTSEDKSTVEQK